jgi:hypothetical protein
MEGMVAVTRTHRSNPGPFPARSLAARTAALVVLAAAVLLGTSTRAAPSVVPHVVVVNESDYPLWVTVRGTSGGALPLGGVEPRSTSSFDDVLDFGPTWQVGLSHGARSVGDFAVARSELDTGWTVPDSVGEDLAAAGVEPVLRVEELARRQTSTLK